eukprot:ctg_748.g264
MEIVYSERELERYMSEEVVVESEHPVLIDRFLINATEVDVDALADDTGRVRLLHPGGVAAVRGAGADPPMDGGADAAPESESARLAHGAVREQGHRRAGGQDRGAGDGRRHAGGAWLHHRAVAAGHLGEGVGAAVRQVRRRGHAALAGDALHRRGDGHRLQFRRGIRQVAGRRRHAAPAPRHGADVAARCRQAERAGAGARLSRPRLQGAGHARHSQCVGGSGHRPAEHPFYLQVGRGSSRCRRRVQERRHPSVHHHALVAGRLGAPRTPHRADEQGAHHHHVGRRQSGRSSHSRNAQSGAGGEADSGISPAIRRTGGAYPRGYAQR